MTNSSQPRLKEVSKKCVKCGKVGPLIGYPKHPTSRDGYASYCAQCKNGLSKERRFRDPIARYTHYIVTRIKNELRKEDIPKDLQTNLEKYLGYKLFALQKHLRVELQEREGITLFECFKRNYHLDHIKPHSSFSVVRVDSEEFKKCWHYTNLMMISAQDNLKKGAKYDG